MNRIALGTAQFGMDYGINNKNGKVPRSEVFKIITRAIKCGVDTFDTAYSYGESEKVLGSFIRSRGNKIKIISKLPSCGHKEVAGFVKNSLSNLNISKIYGYMIHTFDAFKKDILILDELKNFKKDGKIKKIGFSLYFPSQLEFILKKNINIDMVQVPFNIFDQRFTNYFRELNKRKIEIYVRSVFLQGLFFKKPSEIVGSSEEVRAKIEKLNIIARETKIPVFALCLNFVLKDKFIDKVVVGVDSLENFNEIMQAPLFFKKTIKIMPALGKLKVDNEKKILLYRWKTA